MLFPFDSHDNPIVLNVDNEFSIQGNNQRFQEGFTTLNYYEAHEFYELFQGGNFNHNLINGEEIT